MPRIEFNKEPALRQMHRAWGENRGSWLVAIGVAIGLLACAVGYLDLIPEITITRRTGKASLVLGGRSLLVHFVGCASDEGQVVAMLYDGESFNEDSVPIRIDTLRIEEQSATWSIHNLPHGRYAVYAFHDIDANDLVNPGQEPQGLSVDPKRLTEPASVSSSAIDYSHAAFDFTVNQQVVTVELH